MKGFYKVKESWDFANYYNGDLVAAGGFLWPPRCYKCSFCKREFRSAQALGGHMNVHRRDRARLRQSPPRDFSNNSCNNQSLLDLNLCPNPSFNQNPSSTLPMSSSHLSDQFPHFTPKVPQVLASSHFGSCVPVHVSYPISSAVEMGIATNLGKMKGREGHLGVEKYDEFVNEKRSENIAKKREFVRLDLEIGLISEYKEELDLELRL